MKHLDFVPKAKKTLGSKIVNNFEYKMPIASAQVKSCLLLAALSSQKNIKITEDGHCRLRNLKQKIISKTNFYIKTSNSFKNSSTTSDGFK